MARVLAVSSHVARGHVGLAATVPALQWLGHEVWALPTVVLASRPGLGRMARHNLPPADLEAMLAALEADGCWAMLDAVLTGYFPSPDAVEVVAKAVASFRRARPQAHVLVDPILGDTGRLYVGEDTASAIRDRLVPQASVITPNLFELGWLCGEKPASAAEIAQAARRLEPPTVVVTSATESAESVATLLIQGNRATERSMPRRSGIPNGAGDLFSGLILGHMLRGRNLDSALESSLRDLEKVLAVSENRPTLDISALTGEQEQA